MAQAKTLNKTELKQLLDVTNSCSRYPLRDSTMLLFTHLCGLRVGEVAALRFDDVLDSNDIVRDEMTRCQDVLERPVVLCGVVWVI